MYTFWGSRLISTKGRELLKAAKETGCEFLSTGKPTYWPSDVNKIPDLIDFFLVKQISKNFLHIEEEFDLSSDHSPICLTVSDTVILKPAKPFLVNKFTDWEYFRTLLEENMELKYIQNAEKLEEYTIWFSNRVQQAAWNSTPTVKHKQTGSDYPKEVKVMVQNKRRLRRIWQTKRHPRDRTNYNRATKQLTRKLKEIASQTFQNFVSKLSTDKTNEYSLWKAVKAGKAPVKMHHPIRTQNGQWTRTHKQKATLFSEHLEIIFTPNTEDNELSNIQYSIPESEMDDVTTEEVRTEIGKLPLKKAPGFDLITAEILRQLPDKAITILTYIIQMALKLKFIPIYWKTAQVIMIPKPGKPPNEASAYRPISLLPILAKLVEKIFLNRLMPLIEDKQLLPTHQFGFRAKHSTIEQVHRITNIIEDTLENKMICSAVFLDVAKAFDKVWHKGLLTKISSVLPRNFCLLIKSYTEDRYFQVKYEEECSELKPIKSGVPQGSILGPLLYLLYTHDLPQPANTTVATFADDTAILSVGHTEEEAAEHLQNAVNTIYSWTDSWHIMINNDKSTHINFTNRKINNLPIFINGSIVPYHNTAKYLGMTLDAKLKWKEHVKKKKEELDIRYRNLDWLLGRHSSLSLQNKLSIYSQIIKPVWTYGVQLWGCAKPTIINKIQSFQNKLLRRLVNAPWYVRNSDLHRDLKVDTVNETITKFATTHHKRLVSHINPEARNLHNSEDATRRLCRTRPAELIGLEL